MIRKPQAEDFREGAAVTALRESKKIAVEGSKGIGRGVSKVYTYWFVGMMGFGMLMSFLTTVSSSGLLWVLSGGGVAYAIYRMDRAKPVNANPVGEAVTSSARSCGANDFAEPAEAAVSGKARQSGALFLDISSLVRQAVTLLIPALLMILVSGWGASTPLMLAGVTMVALAVLLVARLFSDRLALRYDAEQITVVGLLGRSEMLWLDADDVRIRSYSRFNLKVLFTSGARRNLVISAGRNSLGGPTELLVPVDLLGLDKEQLVELVTNLLCCRAAGGVVVPSWQANAGSAAPAVQPAPTPAGDPRRSFDPDAIMARHLAEREQLIAEQRPDLVQRTAPVRPSFGRKTR